MSIWLISGKLGDKYYLTYGNKIRLGGLEYITVCFKAKPKPNKSLNRINVSESNVTFWYRPSGRKKGKRCTLQAEEFLRRFLQHVLPKGKVRYYGLFSPGQRQRLKQARALLTDEATSDVSADEDSAANEPFTPAPAHLSRSVGE